MSPQSDATPGSGALSKSGSWIGLVILGVAVLGGAAILYLKNFEHYREVEGRTEVAIGGAPFAVSGYQGLEHESWPQRLRGCFTLADPEGALAAAPKAARPEPYSAPSWFTCWRPAVLDADLRAGRAQAVAAESVDKGEYLQERIVAIYPDGRAYQWVRQRDKSE